jgi:membrane protein
MPPRSVARPDLPWPLIAACVVAGVALAALKPKQQPRLTPLRPRQGAPREQEGDHAFGEAKSTDEPRWQQFARAGEQGRGREATGPTEIPAKGWKDILWRVYEEFQKDRVSSVAAGVAFFSLLSVFPGITAMVSSYGLVADFSTVAQHLSILNGLLPEGALQIVNDQIKRIVSNPPSQLTFGFVFGLGLALWSANAGMKAMFDALNIIYDEEEKRGFIKLNLISMSFTIGAILIGLLAVGAIVVFPIILNTFGIQKINPTLLSLLRWPVLFVVIMFSMAVLYRYGPSRREAEWRWITPGSLFATFTWVIASAAFSFYLSKFADYNATYGSLGAVIGMMMWMWISAMVVLLGAEINAELEHQTAHDTTEGKRKPLGTRGAAMADTVGEAKAA